MAFSTATPRFSILLTSVLFLAGTLAAQTSRGTVTGLVADSSKAAVPSATVELTGLDTNTTRTTETNGSGLYRFDAVDPGSYKLTVKLTGFRTFVATQFAVGAAQSNYAQQRIKGYGRRVSNDAQPDGE